MMRLGIDVGSTTVKVVAVDDAGGLVFTRYARHNARPGERLAELLAELRDRIGDAEVVPRITGSVGMGMSERCGLPFVQEVVAAATAVREKGLRINSMIDIGGEDAKVVFFRDGQADDLRMNGNCAGGTGAFIDQMAVILGVSVDELGELALRARQVYPIAARCGVFCKTDIQNLVARNVSREDIAASIFRAVTVQTVVTLAHGCDIRPPVLFCGGPLTFIPALRNAFREYLGLAEADTVQPEDGGLWPALGTALSTAPESAPMPLSELAERLARRPAAGSAHGLPPIFRDEAEHAAWIRALAAHHVDILELPAGPCDAYLGIDSGSTTTKIVVTDAQARLLYTRYVPNGGRPIQAVEDGLRELSDLCSSRGTQLRILGSCSTGYGEDLIRTAFGLGASLVETIAHYRAASHFVPAVSFILDIGGQDMKAIFVRDGIIERIEINEACSSGCGSFIETFARTLGSTAPELAASACRAAAPCDLGTRCTVFMNSKVKQALREGSSLEDVAAGLAYSVVKNCLYKVLKLKDTSVLGEHICVQGGTMRNDAVVRALEQLTGRRVTRCNIPELMGAYGCALHALEHPSEAPATLAELLGNARYETKELHCRGCDNQCQVTSYRFENGRTYYSGNRCEKIFTNGEKGRVRGANASKLRYKLLFGRDKEEAAAVASPPRLSIGIPRCLNMYEEYPFWRELFVACGLRPVLSAPSRFAAYEKEARRVMSDNICFPAKLVHSHIEDLVARGVDRIFMPLVVYEKGDGAANSFNCPVVTGYAEVVKGVHSDDIPLDAPAISFRDTALLRRQCARYLATLGVDAPTARRALARAEAAQAAYEREIGEENRRILREAREAGRPIILLAGRPYHADPLIQHKVSGMLADMGIDVITEDIVRGEDPSATDTRFLAQWAFPNRILHAAAWCASQRDDIPFVQLTSFGCGPDAFLADEVRDLLMRHQKPFSLLKMDDINNIGSMKLRVRSLLESIRLAAEKGARRAAAPEPLSTPPFLKEHRRRTLVIPYFTPYISPLIPAVMKTQGYHVESLPMSNAESCDWGLRYANNEVCYPATLIVGDIIRAFRSGRYKPEECAVGMAQTGGQCRASSYVALIRKALADAGYPDVPVVSLTASSLRNEQPGFRVNWLTLVPAALRALLASDCVARFYHATVVRETEPGRAAALRDRYLAEAARLVEAGDADKLPELIARAAREFASACLDREHPRVGVVGEIYLKFNPFAQKNVVDWLQAHGVEVVPPTLTDFFLQGFVNTRTNRDACLSRSWLPDWLTGWFYGRVRRVVDQFNQAASAFPRFRPFDDLFAEAEEARRAISLVIQFGEGWMLPAEILTLVRHGVTNVISLQPFGCIANHIVAKGMEKRLKTLHPELNLLSLDFDSGVSDVNITNRMLLFASKL